MQLFTLGINHRSAHLSEREKFAHTFQQTPHLMDTLFKTQAVEEAVVLSTCNRTELYTVTRCHHAVKEWLRRQQSFDEKLLTTAIYEHHDLNMIKHLMSVASGLDSMVLGEPQILGQMKQAYRHALRQGTVGKQFHKLFPAVFEAAKLVRSQTDIGCHPVTLTYAVIQLAKKVCPPLEQSNVLLVGAGETIELVANYLHRHNVQRLLIANRTLERAHGLARHYGAVPIRFEEMLTTLAEVDLVISATTSDTAILYKESVAGVMAKRAQRPLFIADLAVPRDIDPAVGELSGVHLYNIDHLQSMVSENQQSRQGAIFQAQAIIEVQAAHHLRQLRVLDAKIGRAH